MGNRYWITEVQLGMLMNSKDNVKFAQEIMENQEIFPKCTKNKNNTQNITPTTNLEGETGSGKINKGLTDIHLEDDTTGSETRRGCVECTTSEGGQDGK